MMLIIITQKITKNTKIKITTVIMERTGATTTTLALLSRWALQHDGSLIIDELQWHRIIHGPGRCHLQSSLSHKSCLHYHLTKRVSDFTALFLFPVLCCYFLWHPRQGLVAQDKSFYLINVDGHSFAFDFYWCCQFLQIKVEKEGCQSVASQGDHEELCIALKNLPELKYRL